jgi:hypothetical protein
MPILCETGGIEAYVPSIDNPWNKEKVAHLYRRIAFGASAATIDSGLLMTPEELVDSIIDDAITLPLREEPEWAFWNYGDYSDFDAESPLQRDFLYKGFMTDMIENGFRDKMTLFWSNHFVTQLEVYNCPSYMWQYYSLLQANGLGNFKTFVELIGLTPAMLVYLNGAENTAAEPNENYGRELYELFTLGENNGYTQDDIVATARALSGYVDITAYCGDISFDNLQHDNEDKTIFGQTGNWGYQDVINILFEQRSDEIAEHICTKLYRFFVSHEVDVDIIDELKITFLANNFDIDPVLRQLIKSEHFFDDNTIGVQIKSPMDLAITFVNQSEFTINEDALIGLAYLSSILGQVLFSPVDVAGWQGDHDWINASTLTGRWLTIDYYVYGIYESFPDDLQNLIDGIVGEPATDPAFVTQKVVDFFVPNGLQTVDAYIEATDVFKWEVPQNYYDEGLWSLEWDTVPAQLAVLLSHIAKIPSFQLY